MAMTTLTLADARRLTSTALQEAERRNLQVSVTVVDARGDLVAAFRMDGAGFHTPEISRGKAFAAAAFGVSSASLEERSGDSGMVSLNLQQQGKLVYGRGAVPVPGEGGVRGAIGVSGASSEEDEEIALAALAAL
jgi:glc operon protein GlcG